MKLKEVFKPNMGALTQQQADAIRAALRDMSSFELTILIKDLEDIKNGGSTWRQTAQLSRFDKKLTY